MRRHFFLNIYWTYLPISKMGSCKFFSSILPPIQPMLPSFSSQNVRVKGKALANLLLVPVSNKSILYYRKVHCQVVLWGLQYDVFLSNLLLHSYFKIGSVFDAGTLFDKMPNRNLVSWSSVVSMYTQLGYNEKALLYFLEFRRTCDDKLNEYILASIIRACVQRDDGEPGSQVHSYVIKAGFDEDVYVGTSLVHLYAKHGEIDKARLVFDGLVMKTAFTWTAIISGYTKSGRSEVSLQLFNLMMESNVIPDKYVLSSILNACSVLGFLEGGKQIHAYVLRRETKLDVSTYNVLIDFYTKCGRVKAGKALFDRMDVKNIISWTTMIAGYMQNSYDWEAVELVGEMFRMGWKPDEFACSSILTSCGSVDALQHGRQIHSYIIKVYLEHDNFVINALIDMYSKCNSLDDAKRVFDVVTCHSVVSYNAMIEGYSRQEYLCGALEVFREMRLKHVSPSFLTFVSLLGLSAALLHLQLSKQIHGLTIKYGFSLDKFTSSALVDVYSKCSCIRDARYVFEGTTNRDIVVWNALFSGYNLQLKSEEAFKLYSDLQVSRERPNEFTFAALITAASILASLQHGQQFHNQVMKLGLGLDPFITNALVDMYAKCGSVEEAEKTFSSSVWKDTACWNSMISMYAQHGKAEKALRMFEIMMGNDINPNYVTFVSVLSACSHVGFVEDGLQHFHSMARYGIEPGMEHYASVVTLLGRAGRLSEAQEFIEKMTIRPAALVWRSLLSACRVFGNVELAKHAAEMAISIDPMDSGSYVMLSNIFASKGMWGDVKRLRLKMDVNGVVKEPGQSWIEINGEVNIFVSRDKVHDETDLIYLALDELTMHMKDAGSILDTTILEVID
ncbi:pentatricopeptide repeat-containing protein At4g39530 [Benincasa hispida]|uniref:pentatricopeptide repeat-containing protein At4g39530 n=1 Tax=Benincasa hispida TaxID=102211 RepID=UPI001900CFE5|nr:pentatricopeptide repeat-containing protein At4g39530 [Benincasa hispida]XP_038900777.1 pentatricopeptide repeat-containing protein At4g39530 [Benincasa hispida]XP_038900778.1 pentatricopeptide repeat-containing protein At4g39530 [Benincasa hispida]XP_038900779.1 pentatricopeptide repeat-containing protein At4g39530 [Benincasa hispida]XP_038900780.1 pentatricopeptide repeat-containing protein At4g39530 [Benincasa hispida]XP_038900781.1 pentatricopeptide repeat-containing protein At4g39530 [